MSTDSKSAAQHAAQLAVQVEQFTIAYIGSSPSVRVAMITNARRTGITSSIVRQALMRLINETDFIQRVPTPEPEADPTDIWLRDAETNEIEVLVLTAAGKREMQKMVSEGN